MEIKEFLWSSSVHRRFNESLRIYLIRTAFSKTSAEALRQIIIQSKVGGFLYLLFGQFDFLLRVWASPKDHVELEEKLTNFAAHHMGSAIPLNVDELNYIWASNFVEPKSDDTDWLLNQLSQLPKEKMPEFLENNVAIFRQKNLIVCPLEDRLKGQESELKAFTVIRLLSLAPEIWQLATNLLQHYLENFKHSTNGDCTVYTVKTGNVLIVRWSAPEFRTLRSVILKLGDLLESKKVHALSETWFVADRLIERDNPKALRLIESAKLVKTQDPWALFTKTLKQISQDRKLIVKALCASPEINVSVEEILRNRSLKSALAAYLEGAQAPFAAGVLQYYTWFENSLRNELFAAKWFNQSESRQSEIVDEWQRVLGKKAPFEFGHQTGRGRFPKIPLGDCITLVNFYFKLDDRVIQKLHEILGSRNRLTHYGPESIDFAYLSTFLSHARICQDILQIISTEGENAKPQRT